MGRPPLERHSLVDRLRSEPWGATVAVLGVGAMPVGRARLERAGFDRFLVKPFGYAELAGAVRELARKRPEWHGAGRPFGSGASC